MGRLFNNKVWVDIHSSTDNIPNGSSTENTLNLLQIGKAAESSDGDLTCPVFSLEVAVAHLPISYPSNILTIEK